MINGPTGPTPLGQVASVHVDVERYRIEHDGGQRRVAVTFNVQHRDLAAAVGDARRRVAALPLPAGSFVEFAGAAEAARATQRELMLYSSVAVASILLVLFVAFR